jgi:hypothetical protein
LLHGSNFWDFSVKHFCFIHTIFLLQWTVFCLYEANAGFWEGQKDTCCKEESEDRWACSLGGRSVSSFFFLTRSRLCTVFSKIKTSGITCFAVRCLLGKFSYVVESSTKIFKDVKSIHINKRASTSWQIGIPWPMYFSHLLCFRWVINKT